MDSMENRKENFKYYYKKPGSTDKSPSVIMSAPGVQSTGGEIIIGNVDAEYSVEQMIVLVVRSTIDPEFHKIVENQKEYFGAKNYEPARQELIRMIKTYFLRLRDKGINLPIEVSKIIFDRKWAF